jgi:rare lipoprotein A
MNFIKQAFLSALALGSVALGATPALAECGQASFYGPGFYGGLTANGEVFRPGTMTAAHPSLPLGTWIRVTNRDNGRSVKIRVNDRGPYYGGRILDLAEAAAQRLGMVKSGVARVCISRL